MWLKKNKSLAARVRAKRSSVKFSRVSTKTEGAPRFLCHQSVILGGKIEPLLVSLLLPDPPCFPYFNSDASPVERIAEASMRSSPTPSRKERSRQTAVPPTFHRRSSKAPCVCAVLLLWGEDWWSPRPMAENLTARTRWGEKPTWMRRQSGRRGRERERGRAGG